MADALVNEDTLEPIQAPPTPTRPFSPENEEVEEGAESAELQSDGEEIVVSFKIVV